MEPLGVAASVIAVVGAAIKATDQALRFCRGARSLNEELSNLVTELSSLKHNLDNVGRSLQAPETAADVEDLERHSGYPVVSDILETMRNCHGSMDQLHACFAQAFPSKPGSKAPWFERGLKANKLDHLQGEIGRIRQQIQGYLIGMQMGLTILNLSHQRLNTETNQINAAANRVNADSNRENRDGIQEILSILKAHINKMEKNQDRLEATRRRIGDDAAADIRVIDNLEALRRSSIGIGKMLEESMPPIAQLAAVSNAASAFSSMRRKPLAPRNLHLRTAEENEGSGSTYNRPPAGPSVVRPDGDKRHMSFDDAVQASQPIEGSVRPLPMHASRSFPLEMAVEEPPPDQPAMPLEQFEMEMANLVAASRERRSGSKASFADADVDRVSSLLVDVGKVMWSDQPRTYLVLYLIGEIRAIDGFILDGCKDVHLPYATEDDLPAVLRSPSARRDFIAQQSLVLTPRSEALINGGKHTHIENADTRFKDIQSLGRGGQGTVDKVTSKLDLKAYARKRIRKPRELTKDKSAMKAFENELHNLKRLQHRHLVNFVGSYTDRRYVGIIMAPVAEMDLKDFLRRTPFPQEDLDVLRGYFGCLCSAVSYLHQKNCRHKDIKPANILVKDKKVYITDFGLALDWSELTGETTSGAPTMYTHAYAAPEVTLNARRDTRSDIWSLGCVFLDILTILSGKTLEDKKIFMGTRGSVIDVSQNNGGLFGWLNEIDTMTSRDDAPLRWIESMLKKDSRDRPTAATLMDDILRSSARYSCEDCCSTEHELDFSDSYKASDTDEEQVFTSNSYTRSTAITSSTFSSANNEDASTLDIETSGLQSTEAGADASVGASSLADPPPKDEEPGKVAVDFLHDILLIPSADAEKRLREQKAEDKFRWEDRLSQKDACRLLDQYGNSLLHAVANFKDETVAREITGILLRNSADGQALNLAHNTPLHLAAMNGHVQLVRDLLACGAGATAANLRKHTPLHIAARFGNAAMTKRLSYRCKPDDLEYRDDCDRTALHWACFSGSGETIAALLDKGADPQAVDERGNTAFMLYNSSTTGKEPSGGLGSPAFEDFLEEAGSMSEWTLNALPIELNEDFTVCCCQVCKIERALEAIRGSSAVVLDNRALCEELAIDVKAFESDLAGCQCRTCHDVRESSKSPKVVSSKGTHEDAPGDCVCSECLESKGPSGTAGKAAQTESDKTDEKLDLVEECTCADCLKKQVTESEGPSKTAPVAGCSCADCSEKREKGIADVSKTGALADCLCADCTEKRKNLDEDARNTKPIAECLCPDCTQKMQEVESAAEPQECDTLDVGWIALQKTAAAHDVLASAGFTGKKSYVNDPGPAWRWAMDHVSTLANIEGVVELLLESGADIETEDFKGRRLLHIAAASDELALASTLLRHKSAINAARRDDRFTTKKDFTALDYAVHHVNHAMMRLLLREGYDLSRGFILNQVVEGDNMPPESLATLPMLIAHGALLERTYGVGSKTALHTAVANNDKAVVRLLLRSGSNIDAFNDEQPRVLMSAIKAKNVEMVRLLLQHKPDVYEYERNGALKIPALLYAAWYGSGEIVELLLEESDAAADVERFHRDTGWTVLHLIARASALEIVQAASSLIECGADVSAKAAGGNQPLHLAAKHGSSLLTATLIEAGADEDALNDEGQSPLDIAIAERHKEVVEILGGTLPGLPLQPQKKKHWWSRRS